MPWLLIGLAVVVGCGRDVRIGSSPVDAGVDMLIDAMPSPFAPGTYLLSFLEPNEPSCDGALTGSETEFAGMTAASFGLADGAVELVSINEVIIRLTGVPITMGFGVDQIDMTPNPEALPPEFPQTIWDTVVIDEYGPGPVSTLQRARYFGIDSATAGTPSRMESAVALLFESEDASSACFVTFAATLSSQ